MTTISLFLLEDIMDYYVLYIIWFVIHVNVLTITIRHIGEWVIYFKTMKEYGRFVIDYSYKPLTPSFINNLKPRRKSICVSLSILFNVLFDLYFVIALFVELWYRVMHWKDFRDTKRRINDLFDMDDFDERD